MSLMLLLALFQPAAAQTLYIQETLRGGIAADTSGVSVTYSGDATTWSSGDNLELQIPTSATVTEVYAVLTAKSSGFYTAGGDPASKARINGVTLSSATVLDNSDSLFYVYELDAATFGLTASGSYTYEENAATDYGSRGGYGIGAVSYTHLTLPTICSV